MVLEHAPRGMKTCRISVLFFAGEEMLMERCTLEEAQLSERTGREGARTVQGRLECVVAECATEYHVLSAGHENTRLYSV